MTTRISLVTTTVNRPTNLERFLEAAAHADVELDLLVAGDEQTPPDVAAYVRDLGGTYLGTTGERVERWATHRAVGTRTVQRRNLATLEALTRDSYATLFVDDDNEPVEPATYFAELLRGFDAATYVTRSDSGWRNPGDALYPSVVARGYPLDQRRDLSKHVTLRELDVPRTVGVVAGLWLGDPDVDALERLAYRPSTVSYVGPTEGVVYDVGTWAPINSQNTAVGSPWLPLFQMTVGVGRYDDVVASYVARRVLDGYGVGVRYGHPLSYQARNAHDLLSDLELELPGYRLVPRLTERLREPFEPAASLLDDLANAYAHVSDLLPDATNAANDAWLDDVAEALRERGAAFRTRVLTPATERNEEV